MAVVGTAQPIEASCEAGKDGNLSYTVTYQVLTDSRTDGPLMALTAGGLPGRGDAYQWYNESDAWAFCTTITPKLQSVDQSAKKWLVVVKYEHPDSSQNSDDATLNAHGDPIDINWKISGSFVTMQQAARFDKDGNPIINSVCEIYTNPPLMKDIHIDTLFLEKNTPTIDLGIRSKLMGKVNSSTIWGLEPRQAKMARWDYEILYYGGQRSYVRNRWEFQISYAKNASGDIVGWSDVILNQGTRKLVDDTVYDPSTRYAPALIGNQPALVPLDPDGQPIDSNDPNATLYFITYKVEEEEDFASYGFPGEAIHPDHLPGHGTRLPADRRACGCGRRRVEGRAAVPRKGNGEVGTRARSTR